MNSARMAGLSAMILISTACSVHARDIPVPGEAATLRVALAMAEPGDRIILAHGVYAESGLLLRDAVSILGDIIDPGAVVIDGQREGSVFIAEWLQDARLAGMTIMGGEASGVDPHTSSGGALLVSHASVQIEHVHFIDNRAEASGGAIRIGRGHLQANNCIFENNHALKGGGAVDISYESSARFENVLFLGNSAAWGGAVSVRSYSSCWLTDSELTLNSTIAPQKIGGALFSDGASAVSFTGCVIAGNSAHQGGGVRVRSQESSFTNCTIVGNTTLEAGGTLMATEAQLDLLRTIISFNDGAALVGESNSVACAATNIFGNELGDWTGGLESLRHQNDNLNSDPLFCSHDDYRLQDASPCAPQNNPVGLIGALPASCSGTSILLHSFTATQNDRQIDLVWLVTPGTHDFRLLRRLVDEPQHTAWVVPHSADAQTGRYLATDTSVQGPATLLYQLSIFEPDGSWHDLGEALVEFAGGVPKRLLSLDRIYPNPFNPHVSIRYTLGRAGTVRAAIYDMQGRLLGQLAAGRQEAGSHELTWNGRDSSGKFMPAGAYFFTIEGNGIKRSAKLLLVK